MEPKLITAAELERMTPAEQDRVFAESIVKDLSLVPEEFLARVRADVEEHIASTEAPRKL